MNLKLCFLLLAFFFFFLFLLYLPTLGTMLQKIVGCKFQPVHLAPSLLRVCEMASPQAYFRGPVSEFCTVQTSEEQKQEATRTEMEPEVGRGAGRVCVLWAHLHLEPIVS